MIKSNQKYFNFLQFLLDMLSVSLALLFAWYIRFVSPFFPDWVRSLDVIAYVKLVIVLIPVYALIYYAFNLYKPFRKTPFFREAEKMLFANSLGLLIMVAYLYGTKSIHFSRIMLGFFYIFSNIFMMLERYIIRRTLRRFRAKGYNLKHIVIIGAGQTGMTFANKIKSDPHLGYNIVGFVDDYVACDRIEDIPVLGKTKDVVDILEEHRLDEVVIALSTNSYQKINKLIDVCEYQGVKTQVVPDYFHLIQGAKPAFDELDGIPLIYTRYIPLDEPINRGLKRLLDIFFSLTVIIVLSPFLLIVALLVKLTSPGPIIYKQVRVGMNRKEFEIYKFRSMRNDIPEVGETEWTVENDPRRTAFGTFIRKTSIDELPQFFNVLKGDMSVVGPRPERPFYVNQFKDEVPKYMIKHHVRPGITGWAQVNGWRGDTSIVERINCDIEYIEKWTLWWDIKIFFMTFVAVFKNAY